MSFYVVDQLETYGRLTTCGGLLTRLGMPIDNRPQVVNLPYISN
jgi:hypothetical protein